MVKALSTPNKDEEDIEVDATDRKKDTHGFPFVASSSASHSTLQKDRDVHKWNF
jgi:hypothetical protein